MVNFQDPAKIARDFITVLKLWHAVDGVFIWEYFTTLDYEWSVIRGRRPYRWTIWIYTLARQATLLAVITNMIGFDVTTPINCQAWVTFEVAFAYIAFAASSLLIALRTIAIWNRKPIVVIIAMGTWLTNVSFFIEGTVRLRAAWSQSTCAVLNLQISQPALLSTVSSDVVMLITMLAGLFRVRLEGGTFGLIRVLWAQGVIWLLLDIATGIPASLFLFLNLNEPYNLMFQTPALVVMSIAATRMYRSLTDFGSSDISVSSPQVNFNSGRDVLKPKQVSVTVPTFSPNQMEVGVITTMEQYPMSQASSDDVYIMTADGKLYDKPHGLSLGDDGESGRAK